MVFSVQRGRDELGEINREAKWDGGRGIGSGPPTVPVGYGEVDG